MLHFHSNKIYHHLKDTLSYCLIPNLITLIDFCTDTSYIKIDENLEVITVFPDEHFACFLTDNFHTIIYSIYLNFISNNSLICHVQDGVSYLT